MSKRQEALKSQLGQLNEKKKALKKSIEEIG